MSEVDTQGEACRVQTLVGTWLLSSIQLNVFDKNIEICFFFLM